ncbi:hypothetical protein O6H91_06G144800 [Diphasiastrum complanatum]|uniref:Uncharacterized protein n=1 Tax=Diphasiastrum complanatum TaxID=34168 RepID=A0ACC2DKJ8_DIPCM|nr:hypothetical protein O6H91_06G144800 [Diphasiastrum complanatum]
MIEEDLSKKGNIEGGGSVPRESHPVAHTHTHQPSAQHHHQPDFHLRPAGSFHEALLRLIPLQARKIRRKGSRSPRSHSQPKTVPHADPKPRAQRECRCERGQRQKEQHIRDRGTTELESEESKQNRAKEISAAEVDDADAAGDGQQKVHEKPWGTTFRSCGLYCEVKLTELLGQGGEKALPSTSANYSLEPHAYRTRVCNQILCEMREMNTPFSRVLSYIYEEFQRAIYSSYLTSQSGLLIFEQVPYFELVIRLEDKLKEMEAQLEISRVSILRKQSDVDHVEQDMQKLRNQLKTANSVINDLEARLIMATQSLEAAKSQDIEKEKHEKLKAQYVQLVHELQHTQTFLDSARSEAADRVSKGDYCAAKIQMLEAKRKLSEAQGEIVALKDSAAALTPRPPWGLLPARSNLRLSTLDLVSEICRENGVLAEQLSTLQLEKTAAQVALTEAWCTLSTNSSLNMHWYLLKKKIITCPFLLAS